VSKSPWGDLGHARLHALIERCPASSAGTGPAPFGPPSARGVAGRPAPPATPAALRSRIRLAAPPATADSGDRGQRLGWVGPDPDPLGRCEGFGRRPHGAGRGGDGDVDHVAVAGQQAPQDLFDPAFGLAGEFDLDRAEAGPPVRRRRQDDRRRGRGFVLWSVRGTAFGLPVRLRGSAAPIGGRGVTTSVSLPGRRGIRPAWRCASRWSTTTTRSGPACPAESAPLTGSTWRPRRQPARRPWPWSESSPTSMWS